MRLEDSSLSLSDDVTACMHDLTYLACYTSSAGSKSARRGQQVRAQGKDSLKIMKIMGDGVVGHRDERSQGGRE